MTDWMPPEMATPPEEQKYECTDCHSKYYSDDFSETEHLDDVVCNSCYEDYEDLSECCGAEISDSGLCYECKEHV